MGSVSVLKVDPTRSDEGEGRGVFDSLRLTLIFMEFGWNLSSWVGRYYYLRSCPPCIVIVVVPSQVRVEVDGGPQQHYVISCDIVLTIFPPSKTTVPTTTTP